MMQHCPAFSTRQHFIKPSLPFECPLLSQTQLVNRLMLLKKNISCCIHVIKVYFNFHVVTTTGKLEFSNWHLLIHLCLKTKQLRTPQRRAFDGINPNLNTYGVFTYYEIIQLSQVDNMAFFSFLPPISYEWNTASPISSPSTVKPISFKTKKSKLNFTCKISWVPL